VLDHDRGAAGLKYVYPVVSRRAGGMSIGVNLNPNNACNWRCVYCQVPNLSFGKAPDLDLDRLRTELRQMLHDVVQGDFMQTRVPEGYRRLNDVALSGNGEPTSSDRIADVVELIGQELSFVGRAGAVKIVLITNGSMMNKAFVKEALRTLAELNGEVWFKLDAGTAEGLRRINGSAVTPEQQLGHLAVAARLCPTWIQTCMFASNGEIPKERELASYLAQLQEVQRRRVTVRGVLLYTLARPSLQPGGEALEALPLAWLESLGRRIETTGLAVRVSA